MLLLLIFYALQYFVETTILIRNDIYW